MSNRNINSILLVSPLPPPIGGIAYWTKGYLEKMKELGKTVYLVDSKVTGKRQTANKRVNLIDEFTRLINIINNINKYMTKKPDVLHYNSSCFTFGLIKDYFILRPFFKKIPIVFQCHCNLRTNLNNSIAWFFFKKICRLSNVILTLNIDSKELVKNIKNEVIMVPNFIDQVYTDEVVPKENLKNIVFVGRVSSEKGIDVLIDVAKEMLDVSFNIVGPDERGLLKDACLSNLNYLGPKSHDEVIEIMTENDALILPSLSEGFPLVILEGMACGLPILSTRVGSIPDMIEDKGGIFFDIHDKSTIINAISDIKSFETRKNMGEYNLDKVKKMYIADQVFLNLLDIYGDVISENC